MANEKIKNCPYCNKEMQELETRCTKKMIYGCDSCNTVFEIEIDSDAVIYTQQLGITYFDYLKLKKGKLN